MSAPKSPKANYIVEPSRFESGIHTHKLLYKMSPNCELKKSYRKKCFSKLNESRTKTRDQLRDRFRNMDITENSGAPSASTGHSLWTINRESVVNEVMESVWSEQMTEAPQLRDQFDDISDFMETIRQELLEELQKENLYWEELYERRKQEELEWLLFSKDCVVCFFCRKHPFVITNLIAYTTRLKCNGCGTDFITPFRFGSTQLQQRVDSILERHSQSCPFQCSQMQFRLINGFLDICENNIIVYCEKGCDFSEFIFNGNTSNSVKISF